MRPCLPEGSSQSSRKAVSGSLSHSKYLVRVSALDHSKLSAPLPKGLSLSRAPLASHPPQAPLDVAVWGALVWARAALQPRHQDPRLPSSPHQCCRLPGAQVALFPGCHGCRPLTCPPHVAPITYPLLQLACLQATFPPSYTSECFLPRILKFNVLCMSKSMY